MIRKNLWNRYYRVLVLLGIMAGFSLCHTFALAAQAAKPVGTQLKQIIDSVNLKGGDLGVYIVDAENGREIFDYHGNQPLIPASCNKLFTTSAALYYLGADYTYKTEVFYTGSLNGGVLNGNLIVVGSGDPTISGRFQPRVANPDPTWVFRQWAGSLKKIGVRNIYGDVIGDDSFFSKESSAKGWPARERGEWYCAETSALSFNDNCIDISWQGAKSPGQLALYKLSPPTDYITFINNVSTVDKNGKLSTRYSRDDKANLIKADGTIPVGQKCTEWATVYNPTKYFVTVLKETLEKNGIIVKGNAVNLDNVKNGAVMSQERQSLDAYVSPKLGEIIRVINQHSQNFYAEQLFRTLGKLQKGEGSFFKGGEAVTAYLEKEKIHLPGTVIVDGSGLSRLNRASARQLVSVLRFVEKQSYGPLLLESLPQGGVSGTLRKRFQANYETSKAAPRISGKTGHLGGVSSLTGIVQTKQGQKAYYSIIVNSSTVSGDVMEKIIDQIVLCIASRDFI